MLRIEQLISIITSARPIQAALAWAAMLSVDAAMPLLLGIVSPGYALVPIVSAGSRTFLGVLGAIGAKAAARTSASHHLCDVLGRVCPGAHHRDWKAVRDCGLKFRLSRLRASNLL